MNPLVLRRSGTFGAGAGIFERTGTLQMQRRLLALGPPQLVGARQARPGLGPRMTAQIGLGGRAGQRVAIDTGSRPTARGIDEDWQGAVDLGHEIEQHGRLGA